MLSDLIFKLIIYHYLYHYPQSCQPNRHGIIFRGSHRSGFVKKVFLKILQNSLEKICQSLFFRPQACNFIEKETLTRVFPFKFIEIFKNTFFTEHLRETASVFHWRKKKYTLQSWKEQNWYDIFLCSYYKLFTKFGSGIFWLKEN